MRLLSHATDGPIEAVRQFVREFVAEIDTLDERMNAGQNVNITMTLTLELDKALMSRFQHQVKMAYKRER